MRRVSLWCVMLAVVLGLQFRRRAWAIDTIWTFNGDGNWTDAANWSNGQPINDTYNVFIDDGDTAVTVTLNTSRTMGSLTLGSDDTLQIQNLSTATLTLTSANGFTNDGSILLMATGTGATSLTITSGTLTNSATGLLHFQSGGSASRVFSGDLLNNGTVTVDRSTTFNKSGGSYTNHGQFTINSGNTLTISGGGTFTQAGGTLDVNATVDLNNGSILNLNGGVMNMAGNVTLAGTGNVFTQDGGTLDYTSGSISSGLYQYLGGTISGTPQLSGATLEIGPTATDPVSFLLTNDNTLVGDVHAGQTLTVQDTSTVVQGLTSANGFTNDGSILLMATGTGATSLTITSGTLTNSATGLLHFQSGGSASRVFSGDLLNNGTVTVDRSTTFNKSGGSYTNHGQFTINSGNTLTISDGSLTNFAANTLTAGTYDITGTLRFPGADIVTNQAEIILRGASSKILNDTGGIDALANLAAIGPSGALRLFSGRNFSAAVPFANEGKLELGGTTFAAPSLANAATGEVFGFGTIAVRPQTPASSAPSAARSRFRQEFKGAAAVCNLILAQRSILAARRWHPAPIFSSTTARN